MFVLQINAPNFYFFDMLSEKWAESKCLYIIRAWFRAGCCEVEIFMLTASFGIVEKKVIDICYR